MRSLLSLSIAMLSALATGVTCGQEEEVEIHGEQGTLRSITPTLTLLEKDGRTVAISNGAFLQGTTKQ